jgi:hypothetical protein
MNKSIHYPNKHEELLRKAGLLGTGVLEVRAVQKYKLQQVSDDGITFREERRPEIDGIATGVTTAIYNQSGLIAGYWANGLSADEKRIINEECSVPFIYLNEAINPITGKPYQPDTYLHVKEGQFYDMTNPRDVAMVRVLFEVVSTIGQNKQEAVDNGAMFYFFSREEEKAEKAKEVKMRRGAAALIDKLSNSEKHKIVRIMALDKDIPADSFLSVEAAVEIFDEVAFSMPTEVMKAANTDRKEDYICAKSLIDSGHIESGSIDGPYYKNPLVYGQKIHIADSFPELMVKIDSHKDLIKTYREMEKIISGTFGETPYVRESTSVAFLSKHGLGNSKKEDVEEEDQNITDDSALEKRTRFMNLAEVLKALDSSGVEHNFDIQSSLKEAKAFLLESLKK